MCFYNSQSKRALDLAKRYGRRSDIIEMVQEIIDEQYKITAFVNPDCAIVTPDANLQVAKWGLIPHWIKSKEDALKISKMTLNAKSETAFTLPSFRVPIMKRRCLVPSTGYFEFHHEDKEVVPYRIFVKDEEIFSLGGVYEQWVNPETNEPSETFSILTVPANELCAEIHNGGKNPFRMPLIISRADEERWLDRSLNANDVKQLMIPFESDRMDAYPVAAKTLATFRT